MTIERKVLKFIIKESFRSIAQDVFRDTCKTFVKSFKEEFAKGIAGCSNDMGGLFQCDLCKGSGKANSSLNGEAAECPQCEGAGLVDIERLKEYWA